MQWRHNWNVFSKSHTTVTYLWGEGRELLPDQKQARKQRVGSSNEFPLQQSSARALKWCTGREGTNQHWQMIWLFRPWSRPEVKKTRNTVVKPTVKQKKHPPEMQKNRYNLFLFLTGSWQPFQFKERECEIWQGAWRKTLIQRQPRAKKMLGFIGKGRNNHLSEGIAG